MGPASGWHTRRPGQPAKEAPRRVHQQGAFAIADGDSYAEIAQALATSREVAAKRYRKDQLTANPSSARRRGVGPPVLSPRIAT